MKLRMIAGHPRYSKLVKAIHYDGVTISDKEACVDFEQWSPASRYEMDDDTEHLIDEY